MKVVTDIRIDDMMPSTVLSDHSAPFLASASVAADGTFFSPTLFCIRSSAALYALMKSLTFCVTTALSTPGGATSTLNEPGPLRVSSTPLTKPGGPLVDEITLVDDVYEPPSIVYWACLAGRAAAVCSVTTPPPLVSEIADPVVRDESTRLPPELTA